MADKALRKEESQANNFWFKILKSSFSLPGIFINREEYLRSELSKRASKEVVQAAIESTPAKAGVSNKIIEELASSTINWHATKTTLISVLSAVPPGWWQAPAIPADIAQFYFHVTVVLQKLAYLYGWPQFTEDNEGMDDETLLRVTLFVGVMYANKGATAAVAKISEKLGQEVAKRLPQKALTQYGVYNVAKKTGMWIGIQLTKTSFGKYVGRLIPFLGAILAGAITLFSFKPMAGRLKKYLSELDLAKV